jgi:hypothetical protein
MHEEPKQFFERRIQVLKNNIIIFSSHLVLYNLFKDLKQYKTELAAKIKKIVLLVQSMQCKYYELKLKFCVLPEVKIL